MFIALDRRWSIDFGGLFQRAQHARLRRSFHMRIANQINLIQLLTRIESWQLLDQQFDYPLRCLPKRRWVALEVGFDETGRELGNAVFCDGWVILNG